MTFLCSPACVVKKFPAKLRNYILTTFNSLPFWVWFEYDLFHKIFLGEEIVDINMIQLLHFKEKAEVQ